MAAGNLRRTSARELAMCIARDRAAPAQCGAVRTVDVRGPLTTGAAVRAAIEALMALRSAAMCRAGEGVGVPIDISSAVAAYMAATYIACVWAMRRHDTGCTCIATVHDGVDMCMSSRIRLPQGEGSARDQDHTGKP